MDVPLDLESRARPTAQRSRLLDIRASDDDKVVTHELPDRRRRAGGSDRAAVAVPGPSKDSRASGGSRAQRCKPKSLSFGIT
jgi:hypothetical protein